MTETSSWAPVALMPSVTGWKASGSENSPEAKTAGMPSRKPNLADSSRSSPRNRPALMVDPDDASLKSAIAAAKPDFIQLHGNESVARVGEIKSMTSLPVIKAIAVAESADLSSASAFEAVADMLLFDAKAPANATREGGHGAAFDWQLLRGRTFSRPWLLAGGLNAENVARAISVSGAPGVDVSSGVETAPGQKSAEMIRAFILGVRNATFASAQP